MPRLVAGRLWRQIEFGAERFDFPGQTFDRLGLRKNEADKMIETVTPDSVRPAAKPSRQDGGDMLWF